MMTFGFEGESVAPRPSPPPGNFVALIGDVVRSRDIADRADFQARLLQRLDELSAAHPAALAAPLLLTAGDEIQGLLRDSVAVAPLLTDLAETLFPVRIAWGLGYGPLATVIDEDIGKVDGPCFHQAREALGEAVKGGQWVAARGFPPPYGAAATAILNLIGALRSRWTPRQAEIARTFRSGYFPQGKTQQDLAKHLGIAPSTLSEILTAASFWQIAAGEADLQSIFLEFASNAEFQSVSAPRPNSDPATGDAP